MQSEPHGLSTSVEVLGLTPNGVWLLVEDEELFMDYERFPWFKSAPADAVFQVERCGSVGLHWPVLDVDLTVEMIKHPDRYPLRAKG